MLEVYPEPLAQERRLRYLEHGILRHLQLDPAIVFHAAGFRDGSAALIDNFIHGHYIGVPMLQWLGMTADAKRAPDQGAAPYPAMIQWLNGGPRDAASG